MDISSGEKGTGETLSLMRSMAIQGSKDPRMRSLGISIVRSISPRKDIHRANAILRWVQKNIRYVRDIRRVETLATPQRTLLWCAGDCDDFSIVIAALLLSIGFNEVCFVAQKNDPTGPFRHVFVAVFIEDKWWKMDGTSKSPIGKMPWNNKLHMAIRI